MNLTLNKPQRIFFAALAALAAVLLAAAAFCDLPLDQALYAPGNPFGIVLEAFCYWPLYLPVALLGAVWTFLYRQNASRHVLGEVLVIAVFFGLLSQSLPNLSARGLLTLSDSMVAFLSLALALALTVLLISIVSRWSRATLIRADFLFKFGVALCLADNVVINALKLLWRRPRFDDLTAAGNLASFRPWYLPLGPGGTSFPSGHTAAACGVLTLLLLPLLFERCRGRELAIAGGCYGFIALAAFSRLIMGRHYLSDTVAAAVLMTLLFFALTKTRRFAGALARTRSAAAAAETEAQSKSAPTAEDAAADGGAPRQDS